MPEIQQVRPETAFRTMEAPHALNRHVRFSIADFESEDEIGMRFCEAVETVSHGLLTLQSVNYTQLGRILRSQRQEAYDGLQQFLKSIGITRITCMRSPANFYNVEVLLEWQINFVPGPAARRFIRSSEEPVRAFPQLLEADKKPKIVHTATVQSSTIDDTREI